jgi:hypothetical protein
MTTVVGPAVLAGLLALAAYPGRRRNPVPALAEIRRQERPDAVNVALLEHLAAAR